VEPILFLDEEVIQQNDFLRKRNVDDWQAAANLKDFIENLLNIDCRLLKFHMMPKRTRQIDLNRTNRSTSSER
jgi:hypothetical protein